MRSIVVSGTLSLLALAWHPGTAGAQERGETDVRVAGLPDAVVREALAAYNDRSATRATGRTVIADDQRIAGDLAVLLGPLTVAGEITGGVVVINGDLFLEPAARIGGDVLVVGGGVHGHDVASITGDVRAYRQPLPYRDVDGRLEADGDGWWRPWRQPLGSRSRIRILSAGAYNRVEGLPIKIGPAIRHETSWGHIGVEALGIIRSADEFHWDSENLGHLASAEMGRLESDGDGITMGVRVYDIVTPVEDWHLRDIEAALGAFLFHRDYRDHFNRHGGAAFVRITPGPDVDVTLTYADERWASRRVRGPFTLFRNNGTWRPNPTVDAGNFHLANATLRLDTRNNEDDPWTGWYITADWELGSGTVSEFGDASDLSRPPSAEVDPRVRYQRGFLDLRRYNRVSPEGQLNFRVVLGGWLGGDDLPLQRRFSIGGAGTLPGFDFRSFHDEADVGMCTSSSDPVPGRPAQCERVALFQVEYRGDLVIGSPDWDWNDKWYGDLRKADAVWVLFADAGRGWLVGSRSGDIQYPSGAFPGFGTFRTDVGLGLDVGLLGVYLAKSVSHSGEPLNVFVRVRHRF